METVRDEVVIAAVLDEGVDLPHYATHGASGMDLRAKVDVDLKPLERKMIPTGVRLAIPEGYEAQVRPRSGLAARHGVTIVNSPGTIDADYRGEIQVILINLGQDAVNFKRGERIAQLVVTPVAKARLVCVESLEETVRGEGGFGSTGSG